jgi:hypothetical protein
LIERNKEGEEIKVPFPEHGDRAILQNVVDTVSTPDNGHCSGNTLISYAGFMHYVT